MIIYSKTDEFTDRIECKIFDLRRHILFHVDIRDDLMNAVGNIRLTVSPVQKPDLPMPFLRQPLYNGGTDRSCSSDKQCFFHRNAPLSFLYLQGHNAAAITVRCRSLFPALQIAAKYSAIPSSSLLPITRSACSLTSLMAFPMAIPVPHKLSIPMSA